MQATTAYYWAAAAVTAAVDLLLAIVLIRTVRADLFRRSLTYLIIFGILFWCLLLTTAVWAYWDECYGLLFPAWVRWAVPLDGLVVGAVLGTFFFGWRGDSPDTPYSPSSRWPAFTRFRAICAVSTVRTCWRDAPCSPT